MKDNKSPLLSVSVITYQHGQFIKQCLDSILSQVTRFNFEILVGEDGSTDGTREICIDYANNYPDKIKLFLHDRDEQGPKDGALRAALNGVNNLQQAKGKYIALCEGDDYWTDPNKLQKQVDFLENNDDFSICYHDVNTLDNGVFYGSQAPIPDKDVITIVDLANENCIHTPSCVFKNNLKGDLPDFFNVSPVGDYLLHMLNAQYGKIKFLPEKMAVYRVHSGGVWNGRTTANRLSAWLDVLALLITHFKEHQEVHDALQNQRLNTLMRLVKIAASTNNKEFMVNALAKTGEWETEYIAQYILEINEQLNNSSKLSFIINHISLKDAFKLLLKKLYYRLLTR